MNYLLFFLIIILTILLIVVWTRRIKENKEIQLKNTEANSKLNFLTSLIDKYNEELHQCEEELAQKKSLLQSRYSAINDCNEIISNKQILLNELKSQENDSRDRIVKIQNTISQTFDHQKEMAKDAFKNYCDILDKSYQEKEEQYNKLCESLELAYGKKQEKLIAETDKIEKDLDELRKSKAAAIEAARREEQIKADLSSYCIQISEVDKNDIKYLNSIKPSLSKPRVLSMLIWSTYFQKPLKTLTANILGTGIVTGIYKITNQVTNECYIGQAANIGTRWSEHAKCGLGIDAAAGNKLYKAMQQYGLWNFSWELLEKCDSSQLNERERFYISMYNSVDFGYNSTKGNK